MKVHLRCGQTVRCGAGRRWKSQQITSTASLAAVTCRSCRRLAQPNHEEET